MNLKKEGNNKDNKNLEEKHSKTEKKANLKVLKQDLKWNKKRNSSLCGGYKVGLRLFKKRERKLA